LYIFQLLNVEIEIKPVKFHPMRRTTLLYSELPIVFRLQTCLCRQSGFFGRSFALFSFSNEMCVCFMVLAGLVKPAGTYSAKSPPRSKCHQSSRHSINRTKQICFFVICSCGIQSSHYLFV